MEKKFFFENIKFIPFTGSSRGSIMLEISSFFSLIIRKKGIKKFESQNLTWMRYGLIPKKNPKAARVAQIAKALNQSYMPRVRAPQCIIFFLHFGSKNHRINHENRRFNKKTFNIPKLYMFGWKKYSTIKKAL